MPNEAMTLLTSEQAKKFSGLRDTFPNCDLVMIRDVEESVFMSELSWELYDALKANLTNLSAATKWQSGTNYAINSIVYFNEVYYKALQNTTTQPPTVGHWDIVPKFQEPCIEYFWCNYLGRYLSLRLHQSVMFTDFKQTERDYPLSSAELSAKQQAISNSILQSKGNMDAYIARMLADTNTPTNCKAILEKYPKKVQIGCGANQPTYANKGGSIWA